MTHMPARMQPAHPLDSWLSPDLARVSPPNAPSRLRQLADAQGTLAAAWSSAISGGPVLVFTGGFVSVLTGNTVWVLVLGLIGAALTVAGLLAWKRVRATVPSTDTALITRGPGSARGGITMVAVLAGLTGAGMAATLPSAEERGTVVALVGAYLLLVALLTACILVPSAVMGRARQSFRRRLHTDPHLRRAVEGDLATWRDPNGNAGYGPL
ncbi:hypothetical protein JOE31_003857 [Arthrobacter sp. PvP023]|uniref:hypothetical protein n=1 Tax=Micrococcaceae TaxID=1268 RepID=UPI001AE1AF38|nr:hypothetical protein [Arthrobacter sp. PvP023]MBP1137625.1 hypothetical protein [Arthrobacter sp. PvP023]